MDSSYGNTNGGDAASRGSTTSPMDGNVELFLRNCVSSESDFCFVWFVKMFGIGESDDRS